ncbi:hypothetical protein Leryth_010789 [Lithospermum erythrorhizon]|nr:hypothetical protein Leryth_010789 [Lithospermum erythrorhizon]
MFPPSSHHHHHHHQNISRLQSYYEGGGGGGGGFVGGSSCYSSSSEGILGLMSRLEGGYDCSSEAAYCLIGRSDLGFINPIIMAEDESRNESVNEAASSTSKDNNVMIIQDQENNNNNNNDNSNEEWLQLSIGGRSMNQEKQEHHHQRDELVELNLLPGSSSSSERERLLNQRYHSMATRATTPSTHYGYDTPLFLQHQMGVTSTFLPPLAPHPHPHSQQEINWIYRPMNFSRPPPLGIASSSSSPSPSSSFLMHSARPPFQHGPPPSLPSMSSGGPDMNFRVINPPRRPHSGIWFMLQASQNQAKEPFLPQIPKSYLRIKDGRMTIRLVMKYLVNKLRLENESMVEVTCRGQQLLPFLTLQHVRDSIWNQRNNNNNNNVAITMTTTLLPESSTTDHIMVLHYARSGI